MNSRRIKKSLFLLILYKYLYVGMEAALSNHRIDTQQTLVGLQDMSWRRLQHFFSVTTLRLPRRLQDVLRRRLEHVFKTFSRTLARRLQDILEDEKLLRWIRPQDVFKTCLEDVLKTYLEDVFKTSLSQTKFSLAISVSNKSKCVSNKSLFHKLYLRNLRRIQNASLRTQ